MARINRVDGASPSTITPSLLAGLRVGSNAAWQRFVELYSPLVYTWCRKAGMSKDDAADALQEIFLAVRKGLDSFRRERTEDTFRGWLRVISRNKIRDHFRRRNQQFDGQGGTDAQFLLSQLPAENEDSSSVVDDSTTLGETMRRALAFIQPEFRERTWQAFESTVIDNRSTAEVASDLGISAAAVRVAKCKVLRRLREEVGDAIS